MSGSGSKWTNSGDFYVGNAGTGSLIVESGGSLSNVTSVIASASGSTGTATVTGSASQWINSADLRVGGGGTGALTISDGGTASVGSAAFVGTYGGSNGTLSIESGGTLSSAYGYIG